MARTWSTCRGVVERLEERRLLSLVPLGPEVAVLGTASDSLFDSFDVAVAGDGNYLIASLVDGALLAFRFSAQGAQLGEPLTLDTGLPAGADVSASMDADGDAVVAYYNGSVDVVRISKDGVASAPHQVATPMTPQGAETEYLSVPSVSMDAAGGFVVGWNRTTEWGIDWTESIELRAFDAAGAPRAPTIIASSGRGMVTFLDQVKVAALPDGSGAVFTYDVFGEILGHVQVGRVSESALIETNPLATPSGGAAGFPEVAVHPDGSFLVGYELPSDTASGPRAFVQRFDATGEPVGERIDVGESLGVDAQKDVILTARISVDVMADGGFVAAFVHEQDGVANLYTRRYLASGVSDESGPVLIGATPVLSENISSDAPPALEADADGNVLVAHRTAVGEPLRYRRLASDLAEMAIIEGGVLKVIGTSGADAIGIAVSGSDVVVTRNGTTSIFDADQVDAIVADGFAGNDTIINDTALPSTLVGSAGNDKLLGGGGNDSLSGGDGKDKLLGRGGKDSLSSNAGNDTLEGGVGADRVAGNGGRDKLYGGSGNDRLYGGAQGDWLFGQAGQNQLFGEGGNDRLYADYPSGDAVVDTLFGGTGNDILVSNDSLLDHLFGGRGDDSAIADDDDVLAGIESSG